jgi:5-formyltetrahydrofolate cyclo-ligase
MTQQFPATQPGVCCTGSPKSIVRRQLRELLASLPADQRHRLSVAACSLLSSTPEFQNARCVMLFLSTPHEVDTAPLALKAWQAGKTVVVPKVSWDQRRMLPIEISGLQDAAFTTTGPGIREPIGGMPIPISMIDLVVVPGLGFTEQGYRIGRGMGFYDRFLAQNDFLGIACGLAFDQQVLPEIPLLDHDVPLGMLVTDRGIRRFASKLIQQS